MMFTASFFFGSQLAPMQLFLEEYTIRVGRRLGMDVSECGIFSEGGCAGRACELCVSETADIFATKIICQIDYVRNDKRQFTKLICYSK